jgi:hypothetical protein
MSIIIHWILTFNKSPTYFEETIEALTNTRKIAGILNKFNI